MGEEAADSLRCGGVAVIEGATWPALRAMYWRASGNSSVTRWPSCGVVTSSSSPETTSDRRVRRLLAGRDRRLVEARRLRPGEALQVLVVGGEGDLARGEGREAVPRVGGDRAHELAAPLGLGGRLRPQERVVVAADRELVGVVVVPGVPVAGPLVDGELPPGPWVAVHEGPAGAVDLQVRGGRAVAGAAEGVEKRGGAVVVAAQVAGEPREPPARVRAGRTASARTRSRRSGCRCGGCSGTRRSRRAPGRRSRGRGRGGSRGGGTRRTARGTSRRSRRRARSRPRPSERRTASMSSAAAVVLYEMNRRPSSCAHWAVVSQSGPRPRFRSGHLIGSERPVPRMSTRRRSWVRSSRPKRFVYEGAVRELPYRGRPRRRRWASSGARRGGRRPGRNAKPIEVVPSEGSLRSHGHLDRPAAEVGEDLAAAAVEVGRGRLQRRSPTWACGGRGGARRIGAAIAAAGD